MTSPRQTPPTTRLTRYDDREMFLREHNIRDLMGERSFTDVMLLALLGRFPVPAERRVVDAVLIGLIDHGMSPSAIAARMTYASAPEALQGAVAAGLLGVGSVLVGSLENCAQLLDQVMTAEDPAARARELVADHRQRRAPVPGFGHPHFKPDDPRTVRLMALVEELGLPGHHKAASTLLAAAVETIYGRPLTMNSSMGMAVALGEIGFPVAIMRGLAIICRAAGLVAHIHEEMQDPAAWAIWAATHATVPYSAEPSPSTDPASPHPQTQSTTNRE